MNENWLAVIIEDNNGEKDWYQFDNEEELRYFLAVHEDYKLLEVKRHEC